MLRPLFFLALALISTAARAAPPMPLVNALERLRDQKSYSWEVINADPGPVAQRLETRRGAVTTIVQNNAPNLKGVIDREGNMLIQREWSDGLRLETVITPDGTMVTNTPEGWLTDREILGALAEERLQNRGATPRFRWLRRADRPDIRRPDQELVPFLKSAAKFESLGDTYIAHSRIGSDGAVSADPAAGQTSVEVRVTMNVQNGFVRDYEVKIDTTQSVTRARLQVPVSDQRIVIITYLPVSKIDIPSEAWQKLQAAKSPASRKLSLTSARSSIAEPLPQVSGS